jgi:hypothetical protein
MKPVTLTKTELRKLKFEQLALIDWLAEEGTDRFVAGDRGLYENQDLRFYEVHGDGGVRRAARIEAGDDLLERVGGTFRVDVTLLGRLDVLAVFDSTAKPAPDGTPNRFNRFVALAGADPAEFSRSMVIGRVGAQSRDWWSRQGREEFETRKSKRAAERSAVERTIIIGASCTVTPIMDPEIARQLPPGFHNPARPLKAVRPTWSATVVKETDTRVYVTNVRRIRPAAGYEDRESHPIGGRVPNQFVERDSIMVDSATPALVARIAEIDAEHVDGFQVAFNSEMALALPFLLSMHARHLQNDAMRDDLIREAIEAEARAAGPKP